MFTISTPRLLIREFIPDDATCLQNLNSDDNVMRYTGDSTFPDVAAALTFINNYKQIYLNQGYGRWAVEHRDTGVFIGFCGLSRSTDDQPVDLAFRLFRDYWASGYATEASRACLQAGFENFGLEEIIGRVMRENLPSISVLQKLGMSYRQMDEEDGQFWLIYGISKSLFERRKVTR